MAIANGVQEQVFEGSQSDNGFNFVPIPSDEFKPVADALVSAYLAKRKFPPRIVRFTVSRWSVSLVGPLLDEVIDQDMQPDIAVGFVLTRIRNALGELGFASSLQLDLGDGEKHRLFVSDSADPPFFSLSGAQPAPSQSSEAPESSQPHSSQVQSSQAPSSQVPSTVRSSQETSSQSTIAGTQQSAIVGGTQDSEPVSQDSMYIELDDGLDAQIAAYKFSPSE